MTDIRVDDQGRRYHDCGFSWCDAYEGYDAGYHYGEVVLVGGTLDPIGVVGDALQLPYVLVGISAQYNGQTDPMEPEFPPHVLVSIGEGHPVKLTASEARRLERALHAATNEVEVDHAAGSSR